VPPWQQIYVNDSERWQTFEEAVALYHAIKDTYQLLRYTVVELPKAPVQDRVKFVLSHI
jgi:predicted ATPase